MDNAFDPKNTHLWRRCKKHEKSALRPEICVFVEGCEECEQDCSHDYPNIFHDEVD